MIPQSWKPDRDPSVRRKVIKLKKVPGSKKRKQITLKNETTQPKRAAQASGPALTEADWPLLLHGHVPCRYLKQLDEQIRPRLPTCVWLMICRFSDFYSLLVDARAAIRVNARGNPLIPFRLCFSLASLKSLELVPGHGLYCTIKDPLRITPWNSRIRKQSLIRYFLHGSEEGLVLNALFVSVLSEDLVVLVLDYLSNDFLFTSFLAKQNRLCANLNVEPHTVSFSLDESVGKARKGVVAMCERPNRFLQFRIFPDFYQS
jgi:hypothetical protein